MRRGRKRTRSRPAFPDWGEVQKKALGIVKPRLGSGKKCVARQCGGGDQIADNVGGRGATNRGRNGKMVARGGRGADSGEGGTGPASRRGRRRRGAVNPDCSAFYVFIKVRANWSRRGSWGCRPAQSDREIGMAATVRTAFRLTYRIGDNLQFL